MADSTPHQLAMQNQYLMAENRILRARLPKHIKTTAAEREQLLKYGAPLGPAVKDLISIVTYRSFTRWLRQRGKSRQCRGFGRPRKSQFLRALILRLARENNWGSKRILGELRKISRHFVCRTTVQNILKENAIDPGPRRGGLTWKQFLDRHKQTLWACDFFTKNVWTTRGLKQYYVLFFIHCKTRKVILAGATVNPNDSWMTQQARNICMQIQDEPMKPRIILHDRDTKYSDRFRRLLMAEGIKLLRLPVQSPNLNAFAERWVKTVKEECLDHFVVVGERHLNYLLNEYVDYYNTQRPHQGLGNKIPMNKGEPSDKQERGEVRCDERLGGLLKHYYRVAA